MRENTLIARQELNDYLAGPVEIKLTPEEQEELWSREDREASRLINIAQREIREERMAEIRKYIEEGRICRDCYFANENECDYIRSGSCELAKLGAYDLPWEKK